MNGAPGSAALPIVILVHGIRTSAEWTRMVKAELEKRPGYTVIPLRYGYFDLFRFWLPIAARNGPVKRLTRLIQLVRAQHPTSSISIIAHSFGTFAIARILQQNRHININRLILCGSVVPQNFRWEDVAGQIELPVLNECGTLDIWPVFASMMTVGYGATGTLGFGDPCVSDRYHRLSHSGFFDRAFIQRFWIPFIEAGSVLESEPDGQYHRIAWWMSALSSGLARCLFVAALLILFLIPLLRASYESRSDPIGHALAIVGFKRSIPGNTGWVWLGRFDTGNQKWIEGPYFATEGDDSRPFSPPQDGSHIILTRSSRVMVHGWKRGGFNVDHLQVICYEYDQDVDDTGRRLPPGSHLIVRRAPKDCTFGDGEIAVWVRVAYP